MREIQLTKGKVTIVDDEDFERVNKFKWFIFNGYVVHSIKSDDKWTSQSMHRLILNAPEGKQVDHINSDRLDNRKENLRICNRSENQWNRSKQKNGTSGFKGVSFHKAAKK